MDKDPRSIVVLILAIGITTAMIATALTPYYLHEPISDQRSETISMVVIAIIAIIAGFVSKNGGK